MSRARRKRIGVSKEFIKLCAAFIKSQHSSTQINLNNTEHGHVLLHVFKGSAFNQWEHVEQKFPEHSSIIHIFFNKNKPRHEGTFEAFENTQLINDFTFVEEPAQSSYVKSVDSQNEYDLAEEIMGLYYLVYSNQLEDGYSFEAGLY